MTQRANFPPANTLVCKRQIELSHRISTVRALCPSFAEAGPDTVATILDEAARFAQDVLSPLNTAMDTNGIALANGRVATAPGHQDAWARFVSSGWPTLDQPEEVGGQALPLCLALLVQEQFDRVCPAFGMLAVPQRAAARLIAAFGNDHTKAELLPGLTSGELGATICISEAGAGSDVMQMRSKAVCDDAGQWRVWGEKCWISFGDHDLTDRIVHCVIARTDEGGNSKPEPSLFLVEGGGAQPDQVYTRRIEEKLGLHGSPTCSIGFEGAEAQLLGTAGRGLAQMFVMITQMRLAVGAMGLGIAASSCDLAWDYAAERKQGGAPGAPVPIISHPDIQRLLIAMSARTDIFRGLLINAANLADIAERRNDEQDASQARAIVQWLLPIVKTFGANAAFENAHDAIQVLGGAGYTRDWPAEQALRDARVLSIFEGTSGIQALDLVYRRVLRDRTSLDAFVAIVRKASDDPRLAECLDLLEDAAKQLLGMTEDDGSAQAGASAFLDLAILVAGAWVSAGYQKIDPANSVDARLLAASDYWLDTSRAKARYLHAQVGQGAAMLRAFKHFA